MKRRNVRRRQHNAWIRKEIRSGRGETTLTPDCILREHNRWARRATNRINRTTDAAS